MGKFQFTDKYGYSAIGTRDAGIVAGAFGTYSPWVVNTYLYNGTAWSDTLNNMIQGGNYSTHGTANVGLTIVVMLVLHWLCMLIQKNIMEVVGQKPDLPYINLFR